MQCLGSRPVCGPGAGIQPRGAAPDAQVLDQRSCDLSVPGTGVPGTMAAGSESRETLCRGTGVQSCLATLAAVLCPQVGAGVLNRREEFRGGGGRSLGQSCRVPCDKLEFRPTRHQGPICRTLQ